VGRTAVHRRGLDQLRGGVESAVEQPVGNGAVRIALGRIGTLCAGVTIKEWVTLETADTLDAEFFKIICKIHVFISSMA
jgi:hypothetical protein